MAGGIFNTKYTVIGRKCESKGVRSKKAAKSGRSDEKRKRSNKNSR